MEATKVEGRARCANCGALTALEWADAGVACCSTDCLNRLVDLYGPAPEPGVVPTYRRTLRDIMLQAAVEAEDDDPRWRMYDEMEADWRDECRYLNEYSRQF